MILNVALYALILAHVWSNYSVDHVTQGFVVDTGPRGRIKKINRRISSCHLPKQVFIVFDQRIIEYFFGSVPSPLIKYSMQARVSTSTVSPVVV